MFSPRTLRATLRKAPPAWFIAYRGPLFRVLPDRNPHHATETNPAKAYRYNAANSFHVLYASVERDTAQMESRRLFETAAGLATVMDTYHLAIMHTEVHRLLNLNHSDVLSALGSSTQELTGSWRSYLLDEALAPTQQLGAAAFSSDAVSGLWAPSAYATEENPRRNVVLFLDRLLGDEYRSLVGFEVLTPPAAYSHS